MCSILRFEESSWSSLLTMERLEIILVIV
jgi:hypothetical protein